MKVDISGAVTGIDNYMNRFAKAQDYLSKKGYQVINPTTLPHNHGKTYEEYMKEDIKALMDCDYIYMLTGWPSSKGARIELEIAGICGILRLDI